MALSIETKCIHLENKDNCKNHYGAVSFPIYQTATYAHPGAGKSTALIIRVYKIQPVSSLKKLSLHLKTESIHLHFQAEWLQ